MRAVVPFGVAACTLTCALPAWANDYKSAELETRGQWGFGAFEARIRAAQGPGVISTFFLWRDGSEQAPAIPWHEIDFEMGQASGDYQTQVMTPGSSPPLYRTEHAVAHELPKGPASLDYHTYRMEWTPTYIAFFVDGIQVRRETDPTVYGALFDHDASGHVPQNELMELRTGVWPGNSTIWAWSGVFDGSTVPTAHFVDYEKIWAYTPNQSNAFATVLLDEEFGSGVDWNTYYPANWSFSFSASDYVPNNLGTVDGFLVAALTTSAGQGILPTPPADVPPVLPDDFTVAATDYSQYYDDTPGNSGAASCSHTDVDAEITSDPGPACDVGWADAGEWLEYDLTFPSDGTYDLTVRLASPYTDTYLHVEVDGNDVSGPLYGNGSGWQTYSSVVVPNVSFTAGPHVVRVVFDTAGLNLHYLEFDRTAAQTGAPEAGADAAAGDADGAAGDAGAGAPEASPEASAPEAGVPEASAPEAGAPEASAPEASAPEAGAPEAGVPEAAAGGAGATPCAGLCTSPVEFESSNFSSGNLGTGAACFEATVTLHGGVCGNLAVGRKFTVNGVTESCAGNWPTLPSERNGGYCIQTTAGNYPWAYFVTW